MDNLGAEAEDLDTYSSGQKINGLVLANRIAFSVAADAVHKLFEENASTE